MRVTYGMMVRSMEYQLGKQKEKLNDAETVVASGRQINKPSDNPADTSRILTDRATISEYGQYESNIDQAQTWIEASNTTLDAVKSFLENAKDIASSAASANDTTASEAYLTQMESIYEQIINYANSTYSSAYMYSGNKSSNAAFENSISISSGVPADIIFDLASAASTVTITIINASGDVVRTLTTMGIDGTNTLVWNGLDDSGTALADRDYTFIVTAAGSGGNDVASYPSYRGDEGGKEITISENSTITLNNDGGEIFSSALKVLSQIITALEDTSGTSSASDFSDEIDEAISGIKAQEATLAVTSTQLSCAANRLEKLTTSLNSRISNSLIGDTETAAIELTSQETVYETTVNAVSSVLKMNTLKDYI